MSSPSDRDSADTLSSSPTSAHRSTEHKRGISITALSCLASKSLTDLLKSSAPSSPVHHPPDRALSDYHCTHARQTVPSPSVLEQLLHSIEYAQQIVTPQSPTGKQRIHLNTRELPHPALSSGVVLSGLSEDQPGLSLRKLKSAANSASAGCSSSPVRIHDHRQDRALPSIRQETGDLSVVEGVPIAQCSPHPTQASAAVVTSSLTGVSQYTGNDQNGHTQWSSATSALSVIKDLKRAALRRRPASADGFQRVHRQNWAEPSSLIHRDTEAFGPRSRHPLSDVRSADGTSERRWELAGHGLTHTTLMPRQGQEPQGLPRHSPLLAYHPVPSRPAPDEGGSSGPSSARTSMCDGQIGSYAQGMNGWRHPRAALPAMSQGPRRPFTAVDTSDDAVEEVIPALAGSSASFMSLRQRRRQQRQVESQSSGKLASAIRGRRGSSSSLTEFSSYHFSFWGARGSQEQRCSQERPKERRLLKPRSRSGSLASLSSVISFLKAPGSKVDGHVPAAAGVTGGASPSFPRHDASSIVSNPSNETNRQDRALSPSTDPPTPSCTTDAQPLGPESLTIPLTFSPTCLHKALDRESHRSQSPFYQGGNDLRHFL